MIGKVLLPHFGGAPAVWSTCLAFFQAVSHDERAAGKASSQCVILARSEDDFGPLIEDVRWRVLAPDDAFPLWTDRYTSLWGIVRW